MKYSLFKLYIFLGICVLFITSCNEDASNIQTKHNYFMYYHVNKNLASERLSPIMYNKSDSMNHKERFKIIHFSDPHLSYWSSDNHYEYPNNLLEAVKLANEKELRINSIAATGDFIGNGLETPQKEVLNYHSSFIKYFYNSNQIPSFFSMGNHDPNMLSTNVNEYISKKDLYSLYKDVPNYSVSRPLGENYYYADVITPTYDIIRFIALDMTDQDSFIYDTQHFAIYSQKQISWLCNTALQENMTEKHSIIILGHYPFQPYSKNGNTLLCDGDFVHSWKMIPEIIEAFRKKETLINNYENQFIPSSPINVNVDFSDIPGEFICYLGGHAHFTTQIQINGLSNQSNALPSQQMLLCTNLSPSEVGTMYNKVQRQSQSITSNSFCIYAIDTTEKNIYITFFGAYKPSNIAKYPDVIEIKYL